MIPYRETRFNRLLPYDTVLIRIKRHYPGGNKLYPAAMEFDFMLIKGSETFNETNGIRLKAASAFFINRLNR
ncbi:MAG: hypothetical protein ACOC4D_02850 [Bacteroidota bacterium]